MRNEELKVLPKEETVRYKIYSGIFELRLAAAVAFKLLDFSNSKTRTWDCQVDAHSIPEEMPYDMIIGTDMMPALGAAIDFEQRALSWDGKEAQMGSRGFLLPLLST